jgi:vancomycin permeability regulator SanA
MRIPYGTHVSHSLGALVSYVKRHPYIVAALIICGATLLWGPTIYANLSTRSIRYELTRTPISTIPSKDVAVVFGAGVDRQTGKPTPYLQWRVETAVQLYKAHRVKKILMTADNSTKNYNEPIAMQKAAEQLGVPAKDIVLDYAGYDTYDSCYRAHAIFRVTSAIIITQGYHLPRAVMACNDLGVPAIGVNALHPGKSWSIPYVLREWLSTLKIVPELIFKPRPHVLGPSEPISVS